MRGAGIAYLERHQGLMLRLRRPPAMPEELDDRAPRDEAAYELRACTGYSRDGFELGALEVQLEDDLHAEDPAIEAQRAIEIGDLQRDVGQAGQPRGLESEGFVHRTSIPSWRSREEPPCPVSERSQGGASSPA